MYLYLWRTTMASWSRDDEVIHQWTFYSDDETWEGRITENDDDFSWWVHVPAWGSSNALTMEGEANDLEQARRLAGEAVKVLGNELGLENIRKPGSRAEPAGVSFKKPEVEQDRESDG